MFRFGVLLTIFLVVVLTSGAQNVLGNENGTQAIAPQPNRIASFISIVPIDELTTTTTTTTTSASLMNRGAQKVRNGTTSIEESLTTTTTTLAPALNSSSSSFSEISGENSTTVQNSPPQILQPRGTTTIFVEGTMLDGNGVALEAPEAVATNSTVLKTISSMNSTAATATTTTTPKPNSVEVVSSPPPSEESLERLKKPSPSETVEDQLAAPAAEMVAVMADTSAEEAVVSLNSTSELSSSSSTSTTTSTTTSPQPFTTPQSAFLPTLRSPTTPTTTTSTLSPPNSNSTSISTSTTTEKSTADENQRNESKSKSKSFSRPRSSPGKKEEENEPSSSTSSRRVQLIELQAGVQLLETSGPHGPSKTLKLKKLFGDPKRSLELSLARLDDSQWRTDFMQASHYLLGATDHVGFFKVSLESILSASGSASGHLRRQHLLPPHNVTYHTLIRDYTSLYVSSNAFSAADNSSTNSASSVVLLISRLGSYVEVYGLLSDHLMITPVWRHSTTVVDHEDQERRMRHGAIKRGDKENQFYTNPKRGSLLHGLIDLQEDSIGRHMGFDVGVLMAQIRAHLAQARNQALKTARGTGSLDFEQLKLSGQLPNLPPPTFSNPFTLTPEVSLFVDHLAYANHGRNVDELWRYLVIYFTRLDLIFRQLATPSIRLRLRDIYIATKPLAFQKAEPVLRSPTLQKNNRTAEGHRPYMNAMKAINELGAYFYREGGALQGHAQQQQQQPSDLMLVITGADLCSDAADSGWASAGTPNDGCSYASIRGQSFVGGACRVDRRRGRRLNVAVVEDGGYFDGVLVSAHELGHLLGAVHDGAWPLSGILGPGGRGCSPASGQLMAAAGPGAGGDGWGDRSFKKGAKKVRGGGSSAFTWSHCTAEQLAYYARLPVAMCLYHRPPFM